MGSEAVTHTHTHFGKRRIWSALLKIPQEVAVGGFAQEWASLRSRRSGLSDFGEQWCQRPARDLQRRLLCERRRRVHVSLSNSEPGVAMSGRICANDPRSRFRAAPWRPPTF